MAYVQKLFEENFIEYASYVIKDRAIPHIDDGFKPVQRRIIQSLIDTDDGKFNKVANIVGHCMQYHPHGDASIYSALVNLANKDLFIDKQGNFGNVFTGDPASAARYIECRLLPFTKKVLYNPQITEFEPSYDGRRNEPVTFPAKIPLVIILGAEGIAVGMATKILPHNLVEVLEAEIACLEGREFKLYPDFVTGGYCDVSEYKDGNGKVLSRAKIETTKDQKTIIIREIPFGTNTESLIASIEAAARKNKIKIGAINDYTTEEVEIEIKLPRGIHADEVIDGLYAFTDCEVSISTNLLVIRDNTPVIMTVTEVVEYHAKQLLVVLKKELKLEEGQLRDRLHARTLERIFIEERIYKRIEEMKSKEAVYLAVRTGFEPFLNEIKREITEEDIERLLKIPIRRISLYDINKMKKEIEEILARLKEIKYHLANLTEYGIGFLKGILESDGERFVRRAEIESFEKVDIRDAAQKNLKVKYNKETGYLGYDVSNGKVLFDASIYDKVIVIKKDATYMAMNVPDKTFIGKGMLYAGLADKETMESTVFTMVYRNKENEFPYIKRCKITQFIMNKTYELIPEEGELIKFTTKEDVSAVVDFKQQSLMRSLGDTFPVEKYLVKGVKARGVRLKAKEFTSAKFVKTSTIENS
ncbi:DNA topoisomerase IV subunit A [Spirochaeta isovalerica]|uniref:Topoisomerase-4 subunit A n=1 Tax=Spirochaeta isovalerica TaxID=150 RepID=A0A841RD77_9SPIO|nr:DNA topoisomerase IV subunit A [Spirochaeta isovalerica]MBB6480809.1 topoisomerase-4 subunit A [Spirochaeta isovalerica]